MSDGNDAAAAGDEAPRLELLGSIEDLTSQIDVSIIIELPRIGGLPRTG